MKQNYMNLKKLNISYLGNNFKDWFGNPEVEPNTKQLQTKTLERGMLDKEILAELKPMEITLDEFLGQLQYLDKSEWYIGYIRDRENVLRAVFVNWYGVGWDVDAYSVEDPREWDAGYRVFSRDSFATLTPPVVQSLGSSSTLSSVPLNFCPSCGSSLKRFLNL